jgi:esterase/lipase
MPPRGIRTQEEIILNATSAANVLLMHGSFMDGSDWRAVCDLLNQNGYQVAVAQTRPRRCRATPPQPG